MNADSDGREPFNPASMDHPLATQTSWGPCKSGGASFCTHVLLPPQLDRCRFRPAVGACLFYGAFFAMGCLTIYAVIRQLLVQPANGGIFIGLAVGLIFTLAGAWMGWSGARPIVFDRKEGLFWRGWGDPHANPTGVDLARIRALQIVSEYCRGDKNRFYSYELNLVLEDATRVNVVDHGNLRRLRRDAATLAQFLGVPLWDPGFQSSQLDEARLRVM